MPFTSKHRRSDRAPGITIPSQLLKIVAIVVIVVIVVAAGVALWYFTIDSTSKSPAKTSSTAVAKMIRLSYPSDWTVVSAKSVPGAPSDAVIVLQRKDKSGVLVVLPGDKAPAFDTASSRRINETLAKQYSDYKFVSTAIVHLKAGRALFFTYLRTRQGDVHTITILPAGRRSFVIESASPTSNGKLGTEIGDILKSATISSRT